MPRSKRLKAKGEDVYCRKCQQTLPKVNFYSALDSFLDANGMMSVCKTCCNETFTNILNVELDISKAMFQTCKALNMAFIPESLDAAIAQLEGKKKEGEEIKFDNIVGTYKAKLANYARIYPDATMTFESYSDETIFNEADAEAIRESEGAEYMEYLTTSWGGGKSIEDYRFLESSLNDWKQSHKCDNNSELVLMREICHIQLKVRKDRELGLETKASVKALQDIIKTANLSPAQASMANAAKGNEAFGKWIQDIEQKEPAEWWNENREQFDDVDDIAQYFTDFITRPIKNFLTRSRDFVIKSNSGTSFDIELKDEEDLE